MPSTVSGGSDGIFIYAQWNWDRPAYVEFRYLMEGTNYTFNGTGYVFGSNQNKFDCWIGDINGNKVNNSPYTCHSSAQGPFTDPGPHYYVAPKPTVEVTDKTEQLRLVNQYGQGDLNGNFRPTKPPENKLGLERRVTRGEGNQLNHPYEYTFSWSHKQVWQTSLNVQASVKASIAKVVDIAVQTTYGRSWSEEKTYGASYKLTIQPGERVAYFYTPAEGRLTGDLTIYGDKVYVLKNFSVDVPVEGFGTFKYVDMNDEPIPGQILPPDRVQPVSPGESAQVTAQPPAGSE